jgi:hypothetical protein
LITTALLAFMFAGCSKDETADLAPKSSTTNSSITRPANTMLGAYKVIKFTVNGAERTEQYDGFRIYMKKDNISETAQNDVHAKGNFKYDSFSRELSFNYTGNEQTNLITQDVWLVTAMEQNMVRLTNNESPNSFVLQKVDPMEATTVEVR